MVLLSFCQIGLLHLVLVISSKLAMASFRVNENPDGRIGDHHRE
jgi:hypothetical protein